LDQAGCRRIVQREVMNERAEILRRRIALYRRHLAEGVEAELAHHYLREIVSAESELAAIEKESGKRE
jgi:hypothetical protein